MTVLPDLSDQLVRAAERRAAAARQPVPGRPRRRRGRLGLFAFGAVLVSGTALAASGTWSPELGDERRERPAASATPAPGDQADILGVLRRPLNAADRGARTRYALKFLDRRTVDGVRTDAVRLLSTADRGYVLIPAARGPGADGSDAGRAGGSGVLCLFAIDVEGGGMTCFGSKQIIDGDARLMSMELADPTPKEKAAFRKAMKASRGKSISSPLGRPRQAGPTTLAGIVPDGVARVEIQSSTGSVSAAVASNFFLLKIPPARNGMTPSLGKLRWYDTSGELLAAFASSGRAQATKPRRAAIASLRRLETTARPARAP